MYSRLPIYVSLAYLLSLSLDATAQSTNISKVDTLAISGERTDNPTIDYTRPVSKIIADIKITGAPSYDEYVLSSLSSLSVGERIQIPGLELTNAVNRYMQYGYFSHASIVATKYVGDHVWLEIQLVENPRIATVNYTGVSKSDREELEKRVGLRRGVQVSPNIFDRTRQLVRKYYDEKGYRDMQLTITQNPAREEKNFVDVTIDIDKSGKTKINEIIFEGNEALTDHQLRMAMKKTNETFSWKRLKSSVLEIFSPKKLVDAEVRNDMQNLLKRYHQAGYRDAEIIYDSIVPAPSNVSGRKVDLKIKVNEGQRYYIRDVRFVGNTKYTSETLNHLLGIKPGEVYDQKKLEGRLQSDEDAVSNLYYNNGYIFAGIEPVETNVVGDSVSLDIRITEGPQATINRIKIRGNNLVYEDVIRRELHTKPGVLFSKEDLMNSYRLINQIGLFDAEKSAPKPIPDPQNGTVDIEYDLYPKSNDQLNLSIGWSQTGLIGTVGFTFTNFSIQNLFRPSMYRGIIPQGDNQQLSINAQSNAKYYNQISLSFSDPWFGKKRPNLFRVSASFSHSTAIDQRYYSNQINNFYSNYNPYAYGYGYNNYYNNSYGSGASSSIYESAYDSDKSLSMFSLSVGYGKRLNWPDNWFQIYGSLNYSHYRLKNWTYYTFDNFHHGSANDINLELSISRNSTDNPIYTRRGSEFSLSVNLTPPYSLFDKVNYADPNLSESDRYRFLEYHKWRFSGKTFLPLLNPMTVKRTPVLMARFEGGIIGSYNKNKRSPFGTYYMGGDMMSSQMGSFMNETIGLRGYANGSIAGANYDYAYSYWRSSIELRYPLIFEQSTTIWVLGFVEAGNAWRDISQYNAFDVKRSAGLGVRIMLPMVGLLGIDWGYGFDRPNAYTNERGGSNIHFVLGRDI